jgi:hypothetical protein
MILESNIDTENNVFTCTVPTKNILDMEVISPNLKHSFYGIVKNIIKSKGYDLILHTYSDGFKRYIKSVNFERENTILEFNIHE